MAVIKMGADGTPEPTEPAQTPAPVAPVVAPIPVPTPTPAPAPVAAPAPIVEAPAPVETPAEPVPAPINTGVPFYDSAAVVLAEKGMAPLDAIQQIRDNGGVIPDALRAEMNTKLGAAQTQIIESGLTQQVAVEQADRQATVAVVGGQEAWDAMAAWTASTANTIGEADITAYNAMLAQGGVQAQLAAAKIKEAYMADPNTNVPAQGLLQGQAPVPAASAVAPISRAVYLTEKNAALNKGDMVAVQSLEARARHTMQNAPESWRPYTR